ncbi:MAG TPA: hypothetical protein VGN04_03355, partial [Herbaspirillum sp.]
MINMRVGNHHHPRYQAPKRQPQPLNYQRISRSDIKASARWKLRHPDARAKSYRPPSWSGPLPTERANADIRGLSPQAILALGIRFASIVPNHENARAGRLPRFAAPPVAAAAAASTSHSPALLSIYPAAIATPTPHPALDTVSRAASMQPAKRRSPAYPESSSKPPAAAQPSSTPPPSVDVGRLAPDWIDRIEWIAFGEVDFLAALGAKIDAYAGLPERLRAMHACFAPQAETGKLPL